ncbi:hypothetical protein ACFOY2_35440 [Nonomuraea purpurea]|uniref:FHA domain-containing protein n=1 Tax=Nonomuraea purpurea TaxID=1849276 RepID=A0ABV8GF38_9ACTN
MKAVVRELSAMQGEVCMRRSNGTWLNGRRGGDCLLKDGDAVSGWCPPSIPQPRSHQ